MRDLAREDYYKRRAPVYDATSYRGDPVVNARLDVETAEIGRLLPGLPGSRIIDVGCGTGVWTQFLSGEVVALDQSIEMLALAKARAPHAVMVQALFPPLPFADGAFDILFTGNFYGLLRDAERRQFLAEARRVARDLVVLDLRSDHDTPMEGQENRDIGDGAAYQIFRRRFTPESLSGELHGDMLYTGRYFLLNRTHTRDLPG